MERRVVCYACGRTDSYPRARCPCGEPLWFDVDPPDAWPETGDRLWRYADWLPVTSPADIGAVAGGTPLFRAERLDGYAGCRLSVKAETANVTGTFKDRGSAVGLAGIDGPVGTVSHGNMAMSMAAHAAAAGRECVVLVPDDIPAGRLDHIAGYGPTVVRVDGDYGRLYRDTLELDVGVSFVNSDTPLRVAGQKTVALEICEARSPDAIVLPASSGGHASGVWKALGELRDGGLIDALPRLYLVQAAACDPIAAAYRAGRDAVTPVESGETIAYSIANPDPPSGNRALAAVRETGGAVVSVDDAAIDDARSKVARAAGLSVEPASAAALAGLRTLSADGAVEGDDDVVLIATGTGFREGIDVDVTAPTVRLERLADRLPALIG